MKTQEEVTVKRPSSGSELRCTKSARLEDMDTNEESRCEPHPSETPVPNREVLCPVDLSGPLKECDDEDSNSKTVLKIPNSLRFGTSCELSDKNELHQLLSNNLAQHLASRNEKIKREFFFNSSISISNSDLPHESLLKKGEVLGVGDIFQSPKCSLEVNIKDKQNEENSLNVKKEPSEEEGRLAPQETSPRVTSFTVQDILDPHKFRGRFNEDDDSLDRPEDDDDNTYISGEFFIYFYQLLMLLRQMRSKLTTTTYCLSCFELYKIYFSVMLKY